MKNRCPYCGSSDELFLLTYNKSCILNDGSITGGITNTYVYCDNCNQEVRHWGWTGRINKKVHIRTDRDVDMEGNYV